MHKGLDESQPPFLLRPMPKEAVGTLANMIRILPRPCVLCTACLGRVVLRLLSVGVSVYLNICLLASVCLSLSLSASLDLALSLSLGVSPCVCLSLPLLFSGREEMVALLKYTSPSSCIRIVHDGMLSSRHMI